MISLAINSWCGKLNDFLWLPSKGKLALCFFINPHTHQFPQTSKEQNGSVESFLNVLCSLVLHFHLLHFDPLSSQFDFRRITSNMGKEAMDEPWKLSKPSKTPCQPNSWPTLSGWGIAFIDSFYRILIIFYCAFAKLRTKEKDVFSLFAPSILCFPYAGFFLMLLITICLR